MYLLDKRLNKPSKRRIFNNITIGYILKLNFTFLGFLHRVRAIHFLEHSYCEPKESGPEQNPSSFLFL